jgi:3-oxoacyl-[acyl-carrier protein] reductase
MSKNILVTGVSRGLGFNICKTLLNKGYSIYGISRTESNDVKLLIQKYPENFFFYELDISKLEILEYELKKILKNVKIDGLVNNAAIAYDDLITNAKIESIINMFNVNVFATMLITKIIIRNMVLNKKEGSIVNISSISTQTGYKGLSMYASTKGAIDVFSKNVSREWGSKKIRSNSIVAGFMETEMSSSLTQEDKLRIVNRNSLKTLTSLESVSQTVEFLLSNLSSSITGQLINVDSGTI